MLERHEDKIDSINESTWGRILIIILVAFVHPDSMLCGLLRKEEEKLEFHTANGGVVVVVVDLVRLTWNFSHSRFDFSIYFRRTELVTCR